MKFYEGSISYYDAMKMSIQELVRWERFADRINQEIKKGTE